MSEAPKSSLAAQYEALEHMRKVMDRMKLAQSYRGEAGYQQRMAERAKRNTWRQMKGMELVMHEMKHPGNKPFMIGLGVTCSLFFYAYLKGLGSETAKAESKYWQRFHAKKDHH